MVYVRVMFEGEENDTIEQIHGGDSERMGYPEPFCRVGRSRSSYRAWDTRGKIRPSA